MRFLYHSSNQRQLSLSVWRPLSVKPVSQTTSARDGDDDVRWQVRSRLRLRHASCQPRAARVDFTAALVSGLYTFCLVEETLLPCIIVWLYVHTLDALDNIACPLLLCTSTSTRFIACLPDLELPRRDTPCCIDRRGSTDIKVRARGTSGGFLSFKDIFS